jgi:uncharacterized membrane protein YraQ (UPF0718 family)
MKISESIYVLKQLYLLMLNQILGNENYRNSYLWKTFSVAILLSAAVKSLVPPSVVSSMLGGNAASGTLIGIGMGIPFYTCGGAAVPFMETLRELGMSKGAMLAFFLLGPATSLRLYMHTKPRLVPKC